MKKLVKFITYEIWGNRQTISRRDFPIPGFISFENIILQLVRCIYTNDDTSFKNTLSNKYIYPEATYSYHSLRGDASRWVKEGYEEHYTLPTIEKLFYDNPETLLFIIDLMIKQNDRSLFAAFIDVLKTTSITEKMAFAWTVDMRERVIISLNKFHEYGQCLLKNNISKGNVINDLCADLKGDISLHPCNKVYNAINLENESESLLFPFLHFRFKLLLLQKLHCKDSSLKEIRNWKKLVADITITILSAGVLNFLNCLITGRWRFFGETTSMVKVNNVQDSLELKLITVGLNNH